MPNGPDPASGTAGPSNDITVGEGLIELVFRNGFGVGGIESEGLIEPEVGLGWGTGGTQEGRPAGKIEVGEDGANGNGIGDEGDDTHGSTARRAHERKDIIDASDEASPSRGSTAAWGGSVRRTRGGMSRASRSRNSRGVSERAVPPPGAGRGRR